MQALYSACWKESGSLSVWQTNSLSGRGAGEVEDVEQGCCPGPARHRDLKGIPAELRAARACACGTDDGHVGSV